MFNHSWRGRQSRSKTVMGNDRADGGEDARTQAGLGGEECEDWCLMVCRFTGDAKLAGAREEDAEDGGGAGTGFAAVTTEGNSWKQKKRKKKNGSQISERSKNHWFGTMKSEKQLANGHRAGSFTNSSLLLTVWRGGCRGSHQPVRTPCCDLSIKSSFQGVLASAGPA